MKKYIFTLFIAFLLTGCVSYQEYMATGMKVYMGMHYRDLITTWGIPTGIFRVDNQTTLVQYDKSSSVYVPGTPRSADIQRIGDRTHVDFNGSDPRWVTTKCIITFQITNVSVTNYRYEGNCRDAFPADNPIYKTEKLHFPSIGLASILE